MDTALDFNWSIDHYTLETLQAHIDTTLSLYDNNGFFNVPMEERISVFLLKQYLHVFETLDPFHHQGYYLYVKVGGRLALSNILLTIYHEDANRFMPLIEPMCREFNISLSQL